MSYDMLASVWPKYLNLVHQTVSRACRYGLGTRLKSTVYSEWTAIVLRWTMTLKEEGISTETGGVG